MRAGDLPDDVWLLLAEWAAHPGMAAVDRRRRGLLWRCTVVARLYGVGVARRLEAFLEGAQPRSLTVFAPARMWSAPQGTWPALAVRPASLAVTVEAEGTRGLLAEGAARLGLWLVDGMRPGGGGGVTRLRSLTLSVSRHSLGNAGFASLWTVMLPRLGGLQVLELDASDNGIDDGVVLLLARLGGASGPPPGLRSLRLGLGCNGLTAAGVHGVVGLVLPPHDGPLEHAHLAVDHNRLQGPTAGAALGDWLRRVAGAATVALNAEGNQLGAEGVEALVDRALLRAAPAWRGLRLGLSHNGVHGERAGHALRRLIHGVAGDGLRTLDLRLAYNWLGERCVAALFDGGGGGGLPRSLEAARVDMRGCGLQRASVAFCVPGAPRRLTALELRFDCGNVADAASFRGLLAAVPLRALRLECPYLSDGGGGGGGDDGGGTLLSALCGEGAAPPVALRSLALRAADADIARLLGCAGGLARLGGLRQLDLAFTGHGSARAQDGALVRLRCALGSLPHLADLSLRFCAIALGRQAVTVATHHGDLPPLERCRVEFEVCTFSTPPPMVLALLLPREARRCEVRLSHATLSHAALGALVLSLPAGVESLDVDLQTCDVGRGGIGALARALDRRPASPSSPLRDLTLRLVGMRLDLDTDGNGRWLLGCLTAPGRRRAAVHLHRNPDVRVEAATALVVGLVERGPGERPRRVEVHLDRQCDAPALHEALGAMAGAHAHQLVFHQV